MDSVNIAGISIPLRIWSKDELKGLPVIYSFSYRFYDFSFRGSQMILLESGKEHSTPTAYRKAADRIEERFGRPVVFYFDNLVYYQRKRLVEHGVYYICGERDVFLPMLMASQVKKKKASAKLSAAAQYLLMFHLQVESIDHRPIQELAKALPYSYISIAKAVQNAGKSCGRRRNLLWNPRSKSAFTAPVSRMGTSLPLEYRHFRYILIWLRILNRRLPHMQRTGRKSSLRI